MTPSAFESALAERIATARVAFETDVPLEGLQADFVLRADSGEQLVLEAKNWQATPANARRAANQARLIRKVSGPGAFVVVSDEFDLMNIEGVVRLADVPTLVHTYNCGWKPSGIHPQKVDRTVFAAMPFAEEYDDVFFVAMVTAAKKAGASAKRVDREPFEGDIVERIRKLIAKARRSLLIYLMLDQTCFMSWATRKASDARRSLYQAVPLRSFHLMCAIGMCLLIRRAGPMNSPTGSPNASRRFLRVLPNQRLLLLGPRWPAAPVRETCSFATRRPRCAASGPLQRRRPLGRQTGSLSPQEQTGNRMRQVLVGLSGWM